MAVILYGIALILIGLVYLWKPTIFRRGLWMKTSIAIRIAVGNQLYAIHARAWLCLMLPASF